MKEESPKIKDVAKYAPTREEVDIQLFCMKNGYEIYPLVQEGSNGKRYPLVTLAYSFKGKEKISKQGYFAQKFLGWKVHQLYGLIYQKIKQ